MYIKYKASHKLYGVVSGTGIHTNFIVGLSESKTNDYGNFVKSAHSGINVNSPNWNITDQEYTLTIDISDLNSSYYLALYLNGCRGETDVKLTDIWISTE